MSMTLLRPCVDAPVSKYVIHGFGFDHTSNDYKVLRIVFDWDVRFPPQAEIYKLRTGVWETVRGADDFQNVQCRDTQALVNGASHWLGFHRRDMALVKVVVLFHMCDEEFRVMKLSDHLSSLCWSDVALGVSGGLLSLMEHNWSDDNLSRWNVWLMKEYGVVESWTKQFTIDSNGWRFGSMFSFRNNEKIVGEMQDEPVLYDPKTHAFINLGIKAKGSLFAKNTYVESLVLLNK
uniref:F-box protein At3g07870-like n=1 Tax=Betula platyphylla TaxID=78630 RepID=A0A5B9FYT3_BETPL|nr:F-box protein At3g07870-like [Betula platyphylla]